MLIRNIVQELVILLAVSLALAFGINAVSPSGIALFGDWDTTKGVISAKAKGEVIARDLEVEHVDLAKVLYDSGAVFVDARSSEDYAEAHVLGAYSLPVWDYESHIEMFRNMFPLDAVIVTYCSGRECDDSHELAQRLLAEGYMDVRVFIDGFPAWVEAGFPVE